MKDLSYQPKILSPLETKADLVTLEEKLNAVSDLFGKITNNHEQSIRETLDFVTFKNLNDDFMALKLNLDSRENLEKYMDFVERKITELKILKLTLAIAPSKATLDEIYFWVSGTLGQGVLLDIAIDKSFIGGCVIEYDGKYKDYSIKAKLEQFFSKNRVTINNE